MTGQRTTLEFELPSDFADCGSLQWQTLAWLRLVLKEVANATTSPILVVSLANVKRGGAALVGILLETDQHLQRSGRQLRLRHVRPELRCVLETCRLTRLLAC